MATSNAINANSTGLVRYNGTGTFDAVTTTTHDVLLGAASNGITNVAPSATSGVALISQGASSDPTFGTVVVAGGGTGAITLTGVLTGNGTSAVTASTVTQHGVIVGGASNAVTSTAVGSTGQVLQANTGADPTYSTATFPSTATSTGTILRADGTNWVATTATYPSTTTSQQILYSTANNVIGQLTTANSSLAATNASGTLAMRALSVVIQTFTSSGTYTPTTGMLYCIIEVVGSGGGSGGVATTSASTSGSSAGGGGGEYARGVFSAATIGASQSVTIGAGGLAGTAGNNPGGNGNPCSVGSTIISANGGSGGSGAPALGTGTGSSAAGGAGGTGGTGGSVRFDGQAGGTGFSAFGLVNSSGFGGCSHFSGGAKAITATGAATAGTGFGGGAGGGVNFNAAAIAGAAGSKGIVIVTEYVIN